MGGRRLKVGLSAVIATVVVAISAQAPWSGTNVEAAATESNIVLLTVDDMPRSAFGSRTMPNTVRLLGDQGTTFRNSIVTTPLCCPSRATWLTGQYAHNHGVRKNSPGYAALSDPGNILPVWLQDQGYNTAHVGKYLNNYEDAVNGSTAAPAGWDEWHTWFGPGYYNYDLASNGRRVHYGTTNGSYVGRVLNGKAVGVIRSFAPRPEPFYLQLDHPAPHYGPGDKTGRCPKGPAADPLDTSLFTGEPLPKPPSFNESDVTDKPSFIRRRARLSSTTITAITKNYRCQMAALRSVDRGVQQVFDELKAQGELANTVIFFTNDNGYYYGQHRLINEKGYGYDDSLRVPLLARIPAPVNGGVSAPSTVGEPVANIDLAPTIVDFTGADAGRVMDGRSLTGLLRGDASGWPANRGLLIENGQADDEGEDGGNVCKYAGIHTASEVYVEHDLVPNSSGICVRSTEAEHYDLDADPFQLQNRYRGVPPLGLDARLQSLRDCSGIAGRDPLPAGGSHCE